MPSKSLSLVLAAWHQCHFREVEEGRGGEGRGWFSLCLETPSNPFPDQTAGLQFVLTLLFHCTSIPRRELA